MAQDEQGINKLPLEIRRLIWNECLPDPISSPEIYFFSHADFGASQPLVSDNRPGQRARLKVVIEFPVILHLCHESRRFTLESHGISCQWFPRQINQPLDQTPRVESYKLMPCRPYRPETDVFLITETDISDLWWESGRRIHDPNLVFHSIQRIAMGSWHFVDGAAIENSIDFLVSLPSLQQALIIFGYYWGFNGESMPDDFRRFRHLALVPFTEDTAVMHPEFSQETLDELEVSPVRLPSFISLLENVFAVHARRAVDKVSWDEDAGRRRLDCSAVKMIAAPPGSNPLTGPSDAAALHNVH